MNIANDNVSFEYINMFIRKERQKTKPPCVIGKWLLNDI